MGHLNVLTKLSALSGCKHLLGPSGRDEAGRLMLAGAPSRGAHIFHFFAHFPYRKTKLHLKKKYWQQIAKSIRQKQKKKTFAQWLMIQTVLCALTCVVGGTKTSVVVDTIHAGCSVFTVIVFTVVNVCLASGALKAQWTQATIKTTHTHCSKFLMNSRRVIPYSKALLPYLYSPSSSSLTWHVPPLTHGLLTQAFKVASQFFPWDRNVMFIVCL